MEKKFVYGNREAKEARDLQERGEALNEQKEAVYKAWFERTLPRLIATTGVSEKEIQDIISDFRWNYMTEEVIKSEESENLGTIRKQLILEKAKKDPTAVAESLEAELTHFMETRQTEIPKAGEQAA